MNGNLACPRTLESRLKRKAAAIGIAGAALVGLSLGAPAPARAANTTSSYSVTDLGSGAAPGAYCFGGTGMVYSSSITTTGIVVGSLASATGNCHAGYIANGKTVDLNGSYSGSSASVMSGPRVAGWAQTSNGADRAVLWQSRVATALDVTDISSYALGVNSTGHVVGSTYQTLGGPSVPVTWFNGTKTALPTITGFPHGMASRINNQGVIIGTLYSRTGGSQAVSWTNGVVSKLVGLNSGANAISGHRIAIGEADASGQSHAVSWKAGIAQDLGTLPGGVSSAAFGINDNTSPEIVGSSTTTSTSGLTHGFVDVSGTMTDLNSLATSTLTIEKAVSVDGLGDIVAEGVTADGSSYHVLLLKLIA